MNDAVEAGEFVVSTIFGHRTQQPMVNLTYGKKDFHVQMSPDEAVDLAHNLMAAAEAAMSDAFLVGFFRERVGVDDAHMAMMLQEFREWRQVISALHAEKQRGNGNGR